MELRLTNTSSNFFTLISSAAKQFIAPFDTTMPKQVTRYIMPLEQVIACLHEHYVQQLPVHIVYEYYDQQQRLHQIERTVWIHGLRRNDCFACSDCQTQEAFIVTAEQVLRAERLQTELTLFSA